MPGFARTREPTMAKSYKQRKEERIKAGLCVHCNNKTSGTLHCETCLEKSRVRMAKSTARSKDETYTHYGGKCVCCGEPEKDFLCLDHKAGGGRKHRKSSRAPIHVWARTNGFPDLLQLLCFNCNMGKELNGGICPHKEA